MGQSWNRQRPTANPYLMKKIEKDIPHKIFQILRKDYPAPATELNFKNLYELFVSVLLSAQCTDKRVNQTTPIFFEKFADFRTLASAQINDVIAIIRSCGLYKSKANNLIQSAKLVIKNFSGTLPADRSQLETLPGIGRKSASVLLGVGHQVPAFPVDTHVARISRRLGWSNARNPDKIELAVTRLFAPGEWLDLHHTLIRHGRTFCKARNPLCQSCPIRQYCPAKDTFKTKNNSID